MDVGSGSPLRDAVNWLSLRFSRSIETRRRYGWSRMMLPCARFFQAPIWCPPGGGGTREARNTVAKRLVPLYRVGTHQIRCGWLEARSSTYQRSAKPCVQESKVRTGRFFRGMISDHGLFSSYEGQQEAANGQDSCGFFRDAQGHGRLDAGSRAGFISSRPPLPLTSAFQFSLFLYYGRP